MNNQRKKTINIIIMVFISVCLAFTATSCKKKQSAASKIGEGIGQMADEKIGDTDKSLSKVGSAVGEAINEKGSEKSVEKVKDTVKKEVKKKTKDDDIAEKAEEAVDDIAEGVKGFFE